MFFYYSKPWVKNTEGIWHQFKYCCKCCLYHDNIPFCCCCFFTFFPLTALQTSESISRELKKQCYYAWYILEKNGYHPNFEDFYPYHAWNVITFWQLIYWKVKKYWCISKRRPQMHEYSIYQALQFSHPQMNAENKLLFKKTNLPTVETYPYKNLYRNKVVRTKCY